MPILCVLKSFRLKCFKMQGKIFSGGQMEARCLYVGIGLQKYIGKRCLINIRQARQGFNTCRAVSLCGGHKKKRNWKVRSRYKSNILHNTQDEWRIFFFECQWIGVIPEVSDKDQSSSIRRRKPRCKNAVSEQAGGDQVDRNASCSIVTPYFRIS